MMLIAVREHKLSAVARTCSVTGKFKVNKSTYVDQSKCTKIHCGTIKTSECLQHCHMHADMYSMIRIRCFFIDKASQSK